MTTQYTPILKLALPVTGELSGTWGDVVNDNITSMIEQAVAGLATISTWSGNGHTLTTANGTTSESRCAMLVAQDGSGLSAAGEIICPASSKLYVLKNATSYAITLKTSGGSGVAVASGDTAFLFCDGTNVNSCVTTIVNGHITGNLTVDGNATINGNTTLGNATSDTVTVTARVASNVLPSADNTYDLGSSGNSWKDLYIDGTATMALVAISGGTINGVSIGATTPATFIAVDNLSLNGNTIASTDTNGNIVIAPNGTGDVQLDADTVRMGDVDTTVTLTSNGNGALSITTGGTGALTLTTNGGTNSGSITIANGANGNISLIPNGTGDVQLDADTVRVGDSNTDAYITTNGTGNLNLTTNGGTNSGTIQIAQGANGNITLTPNGTGSVSIPKLVWSNGTSGRVPYLTTGGQFTDSANLLYSGTDLTVYGITVGRGAGAVSDNTAVGASALAANTSGSANSSFGGNTLLTNTTGVANTAVGKNALYTNNGNYNVGIGKDALFSNTTASNNTAVGYQALYSNTTYSGNTGIGYQAGYALATNNGFTAVGYKAGTSTTSGGTDAFGYEALLSNTSGASNVAIGLQALRSNTTASNNTAVGYQAGYSNQTGFYQTFVGYQAGYSTTAGDNSAFGYRALYSNTSGTLNSAIGELSLQANTTGSYNVAVGTQALTANTTASNNTAVGYQAGYSVQTGLYNTFMGTQAGYSTINQYNTFVGYQSGYTNASGYRNVAVGAFAGYSNVSSIYNTFLGEESGYSTTGGSNTFVGYAAGYNTTSGTINTFLGIGAGGAITTGSKNTILGAYNGNQGGLDIRTATNNIVLSDGDGEPRLVYYNTAPLTKISGMLTHNFTDTQSKSQINLYDNTNGNTEIASGYSTADFVVATGGTTGNLSYSSRANGYFVTNTGIIALIGTTFTVGSNTYTVTSSSSEGYIYCTPDPIGEAASGTLTGVKYATEGFRVQDDRTARFRSTVGVGNALGSTSGAGITFPATQNASSDANTLDDYEEGTWSPVLSAGASSVAMGTGRYTKVGRIVYCVFDVFGISISGWSGNMLVTGLPFTALSSAISQSSYMFPTGANDTPVLFYVESNTAGVALYKAASNSQSVANLQPSDFATSTISMRHSFTYIANA